MHVGSMNLCSLWKWCKMDTTTILGNYVTEAVRDSLAIGSLVQSTLEMQKIAQ